MKILVDKMPVFEVECPFYTGSECILDRNQCEHMQLSSYERCIKTECTWLKEESTNADKENKERL